MLRERYRLTISCPPCLVLAPSSLSPSLSLPQLKQGVEQHEAGMRVMLTRFLNLITRCLDTLVALMKEVQVEKRVAETAFMKRVAGLEETHASLAAFRSHADRYRK